MLGRFAKPLLVATSIAPVLLTYAFAQYLRDGVLSWDLLPYVGSAACLVLLCVLILRGAGTMLEVLPFAPRTVKSADSEVVGFILAYLLPLLAGGEAKPDPRLLVCVFIVLAAVVWTTNSYHVNPLMGLLGYHFYEVVDDEGVTYLLISRKSVRPARGTSAVVQLTDYMVMETRQRG